MDGKPKHDYGYDHGNAVMDPATGKQMREYWHWGDMQIMKWYFCRWLPKPEREVVWPRFDDVRHGAVAGQRYMPRFKDATEDEFRRHALTDPRNGEVLFEGLDPSLKDKLLDTNMLGELAPMWCVVLWDGCRNTRLLAGSRTGG